MCPHGYHHSGSMATPALGTRDVRIYINMFIPACMYICTAYQNFLVPTSPDRSRLYEWGYFNKLWKKKKKKSCMTTIDRPSSKEQYYGFIAVAAFGALTFLLVLLLWVHQSRMQQAMWFRTNTQIRTIWATFPVHSKVLSNFSRLSRNRHPISCCQTPQRSPRTSLPTQLCLNMTMCSLTVHIRWMAESTRNGQVWMTFCSK